MVASSGGTIPARCTSSRRIWAMGRAQKDRMCHGGRGGDGQMAGRTAQRAGGRGGDLCGGSLREVPRRAHADLLQVHAQGAPLRHHLGIRVETRWSPQFGPLRISALSSAEERAEPGVRHGVVRGCCLGVMDVTGGAALGTRPFCSDLWPRHPQRAAGQRAGGRCHGTQTQADVAIPERRVRCMSRVVFGAGRTRRGGGDGPPP